MNYYPHHIGDYTKDTAHLSMIEDGAYRRLLDLYYSTEKPLPLDTNRIYRLVRVITKHDKQAVDNVLAEFFEHGPDGWRHKRCDAEIAKAQEKSNKAKQSAAASWNSRRNANAYASVHAIAMRTHSEGTCVGYAPNNQEPITNNQSALTPPVDNSTSAGVASARLRAAGVGITPANPLLLAWLSMGATHEQLDEAVARARQHKPPPEQIPAKYLDPIVRDVLNPPPVRAVKAPQDAWWASNEGIDRKGRELGMMARGSESYADFKARIFDRLREVKGAA